MATIFYYPEGPSGPVCDIVVDDAAADRLAQRLKELSEVGDGREPIYTPTDWESMENVMGPVTAIFVRRCRVRTLSDGTKEYYDCVDDLINPIGEFSGYPLQAPIYDWEANSTFPWGLDDNFEPAELNEKACNPHDPDLNIFPVKFYRADGSFVTKVLVEKSSPVTFPVTSGGASITNASISASFADVTGVGLSLVVTGTGTGVVTLNLTWRDDPNAFGQAVGSLSVGGVTLNQVGERGSAGATISVTAGTNYAISTSSNYPRDISSNEVCFKDADGNDCNARLTIGSASSEEVVANDTGYWSDEGNAYAVWVNPEICTLPQQTQQVTYLIDIPSTDTYTIVGAADDTFNVYLNDSTTPIIGGTGGIFSGGSLTTPYSATTTLNQGTLKMVVSCFNSDAGFQDSEGNPTGLAYSWARNPGGWYVKICRGNGCATATSIAWVRSGPHPGWGAFMDAYAVYPSNTDVLKGVDHTATWNINVPYAGDYEFEYAADNTGTWSLDGTQIATAVDNFQSSNTYTITNLSSGPHTITGVVNNNAGDSGDWIENPGGIAWTLRPLATSNSAFAYFNANGDLVVTGNGTAEIQLDFDWDDNPNTAGTALDRLRWSGLDGVDFEQSGNSGSDSATATITGGRTYQMNLQGSGGGFEIRNDGSRICFFDEDGDDCNANVEISQTTQSVSQPAIIASSIDLTKSNANSNLIWHTRMDTGYEFVQTSSSYGTT